jgi:hypothetical protein
VPVAIVPPSARYMSTRGSRVAAQRRENTVRCVPSECDNALRHPRSTEALYNDPSMQKYHIRDAMRVVLEMV